jgi:hypothetical protein
MFILLCLLFYAIYDVSETRLVLRTNMSRFILLLYDVFIFAIYSGPVLLPCPTIYLHNESTKESKKLSALLFFQFIYTKVGVEQVRHFST